MVTSAAFAAVTVTVSGPGGKASQTLPDEGGSFDLNIPLNRNAVNNITVTATDQSGNTASRELAITQVALDAIVVSKVTAERLSVQEVEQLVNEGVIELDDPANYHVSTFDIVLTIAREPVPIRVPIVLPKEEPQGWERVKLPPGGDGSGGGGRPKPRPVEIVVFEELLPAPPGLPPISIPGVIVIEGNIKSLKELFNVRLLLMNTLGIFTLSDVTAKIEFPEGGLSTVLPADGIISFGDILPGNGDQPGQKEKEFIIRGDEIGVRDVKVSFGGRVTGPGIPEEEPIPFNGSAMTEVEVKGPPTFNVQVTHPDFVTEGIPYELKVEITNTADIPAMYASLELDVGADAQLVKCTIDALGEPQCAEIEGPDIRNFGHILPGEKVTEVFTINPLETGQISSCMAASDQNIRLQVLVGNIGCMVGQFPPNRIPSDGTPAVTVLPVPNATGIHIDSPVVAFFSERMNEDSIVTGSDGTFNVFDSAKNLVPGQLRVAELNEKTVAIWQVNDGITNRLQENAEYTVIITRDIFDLEGNGLSSPWTSTFTTTGIGTDDTTPPTVTLAVEPPVNPNFVLPGQIIQVNAYASDQGSGIARVEARIKDLDQPDSLWKLIDQKTVFEGDTPPFIFSLDSANLVAGHTVQFMATAFDAMGNTQNATLSLIIAASADPPTLTLPSDPTDPVLHGISVELTPLKITGGVREVRFYLDDTISPFKTVNLAPYQASLKTLNLGLGRHTVRAVAEDALGQTGEDTLTFDLAENLNLPTVNFGTAADDVQYIAGDLISVRANVEDPIGIASIRYFLDNPGGSPIHTGTAPLRLNTAGLGLGVHAIYVVVTNNLGISNDINDPVSFLEFSLVEPPPGAPPAAPSVTFVSHPENGVVTLQGATVPNAKVSVTNTRTGLTISVAANGSGNFNAAIEGDAGDVIRLVAYDFSQSPDPSEEATVTVSASPVLDHLTVSPQEMSFTAPNAYRDISVTGHYQDGSTANLASQATFSSSNPAAASVSSLGRVVALSSGNAIITASVKGHQADVSVTVTIVTLTHITVAPSPINLVFIGQTQPLAVTGHFSDGTSSALNSGISYSTGNSGVARVNSSGQVTAVANGSTQVGVSRPGVPPVSVPVTVDTGQDPAPTVTLLSPATGSDVERGDSVTITVRADDAIGGVTRLSLTVGGETMFSDLRQIAPPANTTIQSFSFSVSNEAAIGGTIAVNVQAEDGSGNQSAVASLVLDVVDATAPAVNVSRPAPNTPFNFGDTVTITVGAADAVGVTQIRYETTGALTFSGVQETSPASPSTSATFDFTIPFGVQEPEVTLHAFARDAAGNEGAAIPVKIILTDVDITPPETVVTAVADPGSSAKAAVTYEVSSGLEDLDHVELYFRRNGIGTFNRYTDVAGGNPDGRFFPQSDNVGTIVFDSTRMGGDGNYEFATVGVDLAGNREPLPKDTDGLLTGDPGAVAAFATGAEVVTITTNREILDSDLSLDDKNLRIDGATVTVVGVHRFRNVELLNGAVLTHRETTQTEDPRLQVDLWTLTLDATSRIDVTGRGYLGGNKTGLGETAHTVGLQPGAQRGNGGSYGGLGGHYSGSGGNQPNPVYGNLVNPMDLGSGGGAWSGAGGDGGGRLLLGAINVIVDGDVLANGGESSGSASGDGSGGSVNLTTRTLSGTGLIQANGGGRPNNHTGGGGGRVTIRYLDMETYALQNITASGGDGFYGDGADGTVFLQQEGQPNGELVINGQGPNSPFTDLILPPGQAFDAITLQNGARVIAQGAIEIADTLRLTGNSMLTHPTASESGLRITAGRVVEAGSAIDAMGRGYLGGNKTGLGETAHTLGFQPGAQRGNGGSYGGLGAHYSGSGSDQPNPVYGSLTDPAELGSGGGAWSGAGGDGGGRVLIVADTIVNDGSIIADGGESAGSASGDGSGGSIHLTIRVLSGTGSIQADGGGGGTNTGGGGGRIAIRYGETLMLPQANIQAHGGDGFYADGLDGTVFFQGP